MIREGPSFGRWLFGRLANPRRPGRCAECDAGTIETEVVRELRRVGERGLAQWAKLCPSCRRRRLLRHLAQR